MVGVDGRARRLARATQANPRGGTRSGEVIVPGTGHVRSAQKTRASVALAQCGESPEQVARRAGAKLARVYQWLRGERRPGVAWRERIHDLYGISPEHWDLPIEFEPGGANLLAQLDSPPAPVVQEETRPKSDSVRVQAPAGAPQSAAETADLLLSQVQAFRSRVEVDPVLTLSEKAKVLKTCADTLSQVYKLTGAASEMPESKLLKTPAWRRVEAALVAALEPWPEALRAVGAALQGMG